MARKPVRRARSKAARKTSRKKPLLTARNADRYVLYQKSVQVPETDVRFLGRVFRNAYGRPPRTMREDFCGTAYFASEWVKSAPDREAWGVDLDPEPMAWGRKHNIEPLGEDAKRVHLLRANVLEPKRPLVDVQVAFNFSYWVFKTRAELIRYFRAARASIAREGLFILDIHGGYESFQDVTEKRGVRTFRYVWEQASFNPVDHHALCHIHFEFHDGSRMDRAFSYDWRWWSMMEVREALIDAGFRRTEVYCEGTVKSTGKGDGIFRKALRAPNDASYIAYIVAVP